MITWTCNKHKLKIYDKGIVVAEIPHNQFPRLISEIADRLDQRIFDEGYGNHDGDI